MSDSIGRSATVEPADLRIREAVRILENEQSPLPGTAEVAARVGLSLFHFVRLFTAEIGQSPQDYARGIVMRHAASRLRYSDDPLDTVARDFGYASQATFTKAFTRHHGVSPGRWRTQARREVGSASGEGVRLERLPALRCLARRYLGPRDLAPAQWADALARLPPALLGLPRMGLAYDDPRITPPERIRYDCAVVIGRQDALPGALAADGFELLESPAGVWAVADVAGQANVVAGYRAILAGWLPRHPGFALEGDPFLERYAVTPEDPGREAVLTVCLRVRPAGRDGAWNMKVPA